MNGNIRVEDFRDLPAHGVFFGLLSLGVLASRAVIERQQDLRMLRATGFSRALVRSSFFLETGFLVNQA